jgi:hypothetical protein
VGWDDNGELYNASCVLSGEAGLEMEALLRYLNSNTAYRFIQVRGIELLVQGRPSPSGEDAKRIFDRFMDLADGILTFFLD